MQAFYVGIDPGALGGIAVLDSRGAYVAAHRWRAASPVSHYQLLTAISSQIFNGLVYLERIQPHPGEGVAHVTATLPLSVNFGLWQGFIIAAGLVPVLIHPQTWQAAHGLRHWQKRQLKDPSSPGPLQIARRRWPLAPLQFQADDGKAAALLLADLARIDHGHGIDRAALNSSREAAAKVQRRKNRLKRKSLKMKELE